MRDTLKTITENTPVSFGLLMLIGGSLLAGYGKVQSVEFEAQKNAMAITGLENRIKAVEQSRDDISQIKTDIAVIKDNVQTLKNNQGRK